MIALTDEMREAIANAMADRCPVIVSYVDAGGQPHISFRGTTQVYDEEHLAIWARNPEGGLPNEVQHSEKIALLYRNPATRLAWQFWGRARVVDDEEVRRHVYDNSPEVERNTDPERKGVAILVTVDRVIQRGQVIMSRD